MKYQAEVLTYIAQAAESLTAQDWDWTQGFAHRLDDAPWYIEGSADLDRKADGLPDKVREMAENYRHQVRSNLHAAAWALRDSLHAADVGSVELVVKYLEDARSGEGNNGDSPITNELIANILDTVAQSAVDDENGSRAASELTLYQAISLALTGEAEDGDYVLTVNQ